MSLTALGRIADSLERLEAAINPPVNDHPPLVRADRMEGTLRLLTRQCIREDGTVDDARLAGLREALRP